MTRSPRRPASRARRRSRRDPKGHVWTIRHRICTPRSPEPRYRRPRGGRAKGPHPGWGERAGNGRKGHGQRGADPMSHGLLLSFEVTILVLANFLGGFVVTDRMLEMFKKREPPAAERTAHDGGAAKEDPSKREVPPTQ